MSAAILQCDKVLNILIIYTFLFSLGYIYVENKPLAIPFNTVRVTAVECIDLDPTYAKFALCSLKPINRTLKLLNFRVILYQPPVTNLSVSFKVLKRANGYKPFGIDVNLDVCQYFAGKKNIIFDWFYKITVPYTNINHTCPYVSDMIVTDIPTTKIRLPSVFPDGMYRADIKVFAYDVPRALVKVYAQIDEKNNF